MARKKGKNGNGKDGAKKDGDNGDTPDLFSYAEAFARNDDPWTSHAATARSDISRLLKLFYITCVDHGPLTTYEVSQITGKAEGSITPRPKRLEEMGLLRRLTTKIGPRKRPMTVWEAIQKPEAVAAARRTQHQR